MAKAKEISGIAAETPFGECAAIVVEVRCDELIELSEGILETTSIEAVHDMRVATRRLRAALEVFAGSFPAEEGREVLREVKRIADLLGRRRDPDVAIAQLEGFAEQASASDRRGVLAFADHYRDQREDANRELAATLTEERLAALRESVRTLAAAARSAAEEQPQ